MRPLLLAFGLLAATSASKAKSKQNGKLSLKTGNGLKDRAAIDLDDANCSELSASRRKDEIPGSKEQDEKNGKDAALETGEKAQNAFETLKALFKFARMSLNYPESIAGAIFQRPSQRESWIELYHYLRTFAKGAKMSIRLHPDLTISLQLQAGDFTINDLPFKTTLEILILDTLNGDKLRDELFKFREYLKAGTRTASTVNEHVGLLYGNASTTFQREMVKFIMENKDTLDIRPFLNKFIEGDSNTAESFNYALHQIYLAYHREIHEQSGATLLKSEIEQCLLGHRLGGTSIFPQVVKQILSHLPDVADMPISDVRHWTESLKILASNTVRIAVESLELTSLIQDLDTHQTHFFIGIDPTMLLTAQIFDRCTDPLDMSVSVKKLRRKILSATPNYLLANVVRNFVADMEESKLEHILTQFRKEHYVGPFAFEIIGHIMDECGTEIRVLYANEYIKIKYPLRGVKAVPLLPKEETTVKGLSFLKVEGYCDRRMIGHKIHI
jgi:hypothetical protein